MSSLDNACLFLSVWSFFQSSFWFVLASEASSVEPVDRRRARGGTEMMRSHISLPLGVRVSIGMGHVLGLCVLGFGCLVLFFQPTLIAAMGCLLYLD